LRTSLDGYRFIGNVEIPASPPSARPRPWPWLSTRNAVVGGLAVCALALFFLYYSHSLRSKAGQPAVTPAVTNVGEKSIPSLSPAGQHLAFAWKGGAGPQFSFYVKLVGTEESLRLTRQASIDFNPVWSPDGCYIAFCRIQKGETGFTSFPHWVTLSAECARLFGRNKSSTKSLGPQAASRGHPMGSYSRFLTVHPLANLLFLLSRDSLEVRRLTSALGPKGDFNPASSCGKPSSPASAGIDRLFGQRDNPLHPTKLGDIILVENSR
jgi:hypothetical protein